VLRPDTGLASQFSVPGDASTGTTARLLGNVRELFQLLDRAGLSSQDLAATYQYLAAQHPERREAQG
jgi:hypothetical protein